MKKRIKYVAAILFVALGGINTSCTDFDEFEDGRISYDEIFQNDKKTGAFLNSCYAYIESFGMQYSGHTMLAGYCDEAQDVTDVLNGTPSQWYSSILTPYYNPLHNYCWSHYWTGIRYCNIFLENIDTAVLAGEMNRKSWKCQAHALRAYYYWQLIKRYGGVPIVTRSYPDNFDYSVVKKGTFTECVKQIFADCDQALSASDSELSWHSGSNNSDRGKMSKALMYAIKSEAALYAASPLWNDGTITWTEAAKITSEALSVCKSHGYSLYKQKPAANTGYMSYDIYFYTRSDVNGAVDKETIYETNAQLNLFKYSGLPIANGVEKAGACPSQELVDAYETTDGQQPILGYKDKEHLQPILNPKATLYDPANPYKNRDPRLKASIYYNGSAYNLADGNSKIWTYQGGNCEMSASNILKTRTGYYMRKFSNFASTKDANKDGFFKVFRLAELYLNMAEAVNESSTTGKAPNEAVDAINVVRARVGMKALPYEMSQEDFRVRVRNERRVELAFEEHRFFDVRRWKILSETDQVITGMRVTKSGTTYQYERVLVDGERKAYGDKYLLFPWPGDEVIRFKSYTGVNFQNPGWN